MLLEYHQVTKLIDFFVGLFKTEENIGQDVVLTGWYRRQVTPFVEIYQMEVRGKNKRLFTREVYLTITGLVTVIGLLFLPPSSYPFIPAAFLALFALSLIAYYQFIRSKYLREYPEDQCN
jgi:hypothetical protein